MVHCSCFHHTDPSLDSARERVVINQHAKLTQSRRNVHLTSVGLCGKHHLGDVPTCGTRSKVPADCPWGWTRYLRRAAGLTRITPNHCCQCQSHFRRNRAPQLLRPPCKPLKGATKRRCQWRPVRHPRVWSDQWRPSRLGHLGSSAQHIATSSPADRESILLHRRYRP